MEPAPVTSSPDTRTFAFPRKLRWMMIGCALGFGAFTVFGLLLPFLEPSEGGWFASAMCVAVFGGFTAMTIPVLLGLWDEVRVSPDGISFLHPGQPKQFLRWEDIREVRSRDGLQRLEIFDQEGRRRMKLEYQLENFEELDRIVRERAPSQQTVDESVDGRVDFSMGRTLRWIGVAGAAPCAVIAGFYVMSEPWIAVSFAGFSLFFLGSSFWEPHLLEVHDERLVLRSRIRERPIHFRDLIDVRFEYAKAPYSNITARIELRRLRGKPKYLGQFAGGAAPVYRQIRTRWEKWVVENRE